MPNSVVLTPRVVRLREYRKKKDDFLILDDLPDGAHYVDLFEDFMTRFSEIPRICENSQTAFRVLKTESNQNGLMRSLSGMVESGKWGTEAKLENFQTQETKFRDEDDCELIPFFFYVEIRKGQDEGLLILQRLGTLGIQTILATSFQDYLKGRDLVYTSLINPLATEESITDALGGGITEIRYIKNSVPEDIADDVNLNDNVGDGGTLEMIVKTKRERRFAIPQWMKELANGKGSNTDYLELHDIHFDEMRLKVDIDGKLRVLKIQELQDRFATTFDVSNSVEMNGSHPT